MSIARLAREQKRQLGQYLTPESTAAAIVGSLRISPDARILEPSFGGGAFVFAVLDSLRSSIPHDDIRNWCDMHLYGCEIDTAAYDMFREVWRSRGLGEVPANLECGDFFTWMPPGCERAAATNRRHYFASRLEYFDLVIGNPPFGGSINPNIQDELDAIFGMRNGRKIKKETYAFFLVKSVDLLKPGGQLAFICSDTILTIATMTGLRSWLQNTCAVRITEVPGTFADTNQAMILLTLTKQAVTPRHITVFGVHRSLAEIETTPNISWRVNEDLAKYFTGVTVGDKMVATSGMTIGNNELFLRSITEQRIEEPYEFSFTDRRITVEREISRARLGKLSPRRLREVQELEARGATERVIAWTPRTTLSIIALPHEDYRFYNKASSRIIYSDPTWAIFWRNDGEYVYTFKKTGNWYLHGVGGMKYFGREGLSWALIAPRLYARYLPPGYILDSGAPCAFLRPGVEREELFFILGWALTDACNRILKEVLNHTRNIQSKDFERLPYPLWVPAESKRKAVRAVTNLVTRAQAGQEFSLKSPEVRALNELYAWRDFQTGKGAKKKNTARQMSLF
jgi:tRNA1(Val) A37 N6-methylase TrmN6